MSRNGKGSAPRPVNQEVYEANWKRIFRKKKKAKGKKP